MHDWASAASGRLLWEGGVHRVHAGKDFFVFMHRCAAQRIAVHLRADLPSVFLGFWFFGVFNEGFRRGN